MNPLRELADVRQIADEPARRWFTSPELDLIVWLGDEGNPVGFQLCYDKHIAEHALTWREGRGYDHTFVDDGENRPAAYKSTPILRADGHFNADRVKYLFEDAAADVPAELRTYVTAALEQYPGS